jgi:hypothetical protein
VGFAAVTRRPISDPRKVAPGPSPVRSHARTARSCDTPQTLGRARAPFSAAFRRRVSPGPRGLRPIVRAERELWGLPFQRTARARECPTLPWGSVGQTSRGLAEAGPTSPAELRGWAGSEPPPAPERYGARSPPNRRTAFRAFRASPGSVALARPSGGNSRGCTKGRAGPAGTLPRDLRLGLHGSRALRNTPWKTVRNHLSFDTRTAHLADSPVAIGRIAGVHV